jgi:hypothetical protein
VGGDHIQEIPFTMESRKQRKVMNNPSSDQIYKNLASKILQLLLERDRAQNVEGTDSESLAISNHETQSATTERDRAETKNTIQLANKRGGEG